MLLAALVQKGAQAAPIDLFPDGPPDVYGLTGVLEPGGALSPTLEIMSHVFVRPGAPAKCYQPPRMPFIRRWQCSPVCKLDVFTPLKDGPLNSTEIAGAIGVNSAKLVPLLYALVAADLLTVQGDRFSNTPEADAYLVKGRPTYMAGSRQLFYADIWQALLKTADSIRAGAPQHKHSFYDMSEDEMLTFFRGQHFYAVAAGEQLARVYDLSPFRHMLDVGTGSGGVSIGVARSGADLRITAIDLPKVIPVTRRFLEEEGAASRVTTLVGDMIAGAPEGTYDVAVLRNLIQVLSLANAQAVVRHVAQSLAQNGTILIIGG